MIVDDDYVDYYDDLIVAAALQKIMSPTHDVIMTMW